MKFLRTASTRRLLALTGALLAAIVAGTAIAVAASGGGPVPPQKPLARAIHGALAAPAVRGITARIQFTNHLIDTSEIQGSDPLLTGATGRLWLSADHRMRLELQGENGDAQIVVDNGSFWAYDPSSNTVYEGRLPAPSAQPQSRSKKGREKVPSTAQIQSNLNRAMAHLRISGAIPSDVARRPTYTVRVSPRHDGGLLGNIQLAWDAIRGVPLRVAVYARGDGTPVLELKATHVSYGLIRASVFKVSPPRQAKLVKVSGSSAGGPASDRGESMGQARTGAHWRHPQVTGPADVAKHLSFPLKAPGRLVGLPRQSVSLLDWGGAPAALVTYGQNLGGIAVVEHPASSARTSHSSTTSGEGQQGLNLPTVSIKGATGQQLDTALGTMVRFTAKGVTYTVLGSVPPAAADAAARAL